MADLEIPEEVADRVGALIAGWLKADAELGSHAAPETKAIGQ